MPPPLNSAVPPRPFLTADLASNDQISLRLNLMKTDGLSKVVTADASSHGSVAISIGLEISAALDRVKPGWAERVGGRFASLDSCVPTACDLANALGVSERTLRRRLKAVGTSYSGILKQVRSERARISLTHSNLSVGEIAATLGYSETGNFRHAFRRWMGCAPNDLRKDLNDGKTRRRRGA